MEPVIAYIPIFTTLFAAFFLVGLYQHWQSKPQALYLMWWFFGVITYGAGTLTESINSLAGWSELNFRAWYILGALLGGFPLATGTVYLLMKKKTAHIMTSVFLIIIALVSILVMMTPVDYGLSPDGRLTGKVMTWQWVRYFSPFINLYSFIFLFGGAIYSAFKYWKIEKGEKRFLGNIFIGIGALLPGIGGSFTRFGYVEVLYVTELLGLLMIYLGYRIIRQDTTFSVHAVQSEAVK